LALMLKATGWPGCAGLGFALAETVKPHLDEVWAWAVVGMAPATNMATINITMSRRPDKRVIRGVRCRRIVTLL
jgi:hypothetical protein